MTTPAFFARIQPSDTDRLQPHQINTILVEARAKLAHMGLHSEMRPLRKRGKKSIAEDPAFVAQVRDAAAAGLCKLEIARKLGKHQESVGACAKLHGITLPKYDMSWHGHRLTAARHTKRAKATAPTTLTTAHRGAIGYGVRRALAARRANNVMEAAG